MPLIEKNDAQNTVPVPMTLQATPHPISLFPLSPLSTLRPSAISPSQIPLLHRSKSIACPSLKKQEFDKLKATQDWNKTKSKAIYKAQNAQKELVAQTKAKAAAAAITLAKDDETTDVTHEGDVVHIAYMVAYGKITPASYQKAILGPDMDNQWKAIHEEIKLLEKRNTWIIEDLPPSQKIIGCRWTYIIKHGPSGKVFWYKARLVVQGFSQISRVDYDDTFSPTIRLDSLWAILHIAAAYGWVCGQDNVTSVFLHSDIDHVIYM